MELANNTVGYRIKLYPTEDQKDILEKYFNTARAVYNIGINIHESHYEQYKDDPNEYGYISAQRMSVVLTKMKNTMSSYEWLKDYDSEMIKGALRDVERAYNRFKSGQCNMPRYKKRKFYHKQFVVRSDRLSICENYVRIPSIGKIYSDSNSDNLVGYGGPDKYKPKITHRKYLNSRVIFDGKSYYLTFSLKENICENICLKSQIKYANNVKWQQKLYDEPLGIDLGCDVNKWIVDSKGRRVHFPDIYKEKRKIKRLKRKLFRQHQMGMITKSTMDENPKEVYTQNQIKTHIELNKYTKRIYNKKKNEVYNYINTVLKDKPECVVLEDIRVKDMLLNKYCGKNNRHIRRHNSKILEYELYLTKTRIETVLSRNGINVLIAANDFPSSQLCSRCGHRQNIGKRKVFICEQCGFKIDRDENAAANLKNYYYNAQI